jgi:hypothetical protein
LQPINWPHVVATAICLAMLGAGALYFSTYRPKPFSEQELAASQARNLANCGAGMFDVPAQAPNCPRFDAISLRRKPCTGPGCEGFELTLYADGRAVLEGEGPDQLSGRFHAHVASGEFRELANFIATFRLERRGSYDAPPPDVADELVRAGCNGDWAFAVNDGGRPGEMEAISRCLLDVKRRADWSLDTPEHEPAPAAAH